MLIIAGLGAVAQWTGGAERVDLSTILPEAGYERIELRRTGENHWFLFGEVNGRRRSCLVDTGWSLATVSTNTAAHLNPSDIIAALELGWVVLTNQPVVVQDMRINGRPAPYDVVLGCDFLIRHHAVMDCANNRLYLRRTLPSPWQTEELEHRLRGAGWIEIDLKLHEPPALTCEMRIKDQPITFLVDSGAVWSCLDTKTAQTLDLHVTPSPNRIRGAGAAGERELSVAKLKRVRIGDREIRHISVAVFSLTDWGLGPDGKVLKNVGGILGGRELAAAGALIDCRRLKLWLRPAD